MNSYILMLEDDPDDRFITRETLNELRIDVPIKFVSHSNELFNALQLEEPLLVLVDFNSTPDDGIEVLKKLKNSDYKNIPVVILAESDASQKRCYAEGANTFVTKPLRDEETKRKIETFFKYWLEVAAL